MKVKVKKGKRGKRKLKEDEGRKNGKKDDG
jgi:hypothetical protein